MRSLAGYWDARFERSVANLVQAAAVPESARGLIERCSGELAPLGFTFSHWETITPVSRSHVDFPWSLLLVHQDQKTFSRVSISVPTEAFHPCDIDFLTLFADDSSLLTTSGVDHLRIGLPPGQKVIDGYVTLTKDQWTAHQASLRGFERKERVVPQPAAFIQTFQRGLDGEFDDLVRRGKLIADGSDRSHLAWGTALWASVRRIRGRARRRELDQVRLRAYHPPAPEPMLPLDIEAASFIAVARSRKGKPMRRGWKGFLFVASIAAFALAMGAADSIASIVQTIVIVAFHEAGHVAAMSWFGYKDLSVLFLPFFGAIAIGEEEKIVSPGKKAVVSLMGPLPGILLGFIILFSPLARSERWLSAASMLIGLNGLNLLPIIPLDGGHFVNLLFGRWALVQTAFHVVSSLLAVPLMGFNRIGIWIGIGMLANTRNVWRTAALGAQLRRSATPALPTPPREGKLLEALHWFQMEAKGRITSEVRYPVVESALRSAATPAMSALSIAGWGGLYLAIIAASVFGLAAARTRQEPMSLDEYRASAKLQRNAAVTLTEDERKLAGESGIPEAAALELRRYSQTPLTRLRIPRSKEMPKSGLMATLGSAESLAAVETLRSKAEMKGLLVFQTGNFMSGEIGLIQGEDALGLAALFIGVPPSLREGAAVESDLSELARSLSFDIVGVGTDWLELKPRAVPANPGAAADQIVKISPTCGNGIPDNKDGLVERLKRDATILVCWQPIDK